MLDRLTGDFLDSKEITRKVCHEALESMKTNLSRDPLPDYPYTLSAMRRYSRILQQEISEVRCGDYVVQLLNLRTSQAGMVSSKLHRHAFYEADIIMSGIAACDSGGEFLLGKGDTILFTPGTEHTWIKNTENSHRLTLEFNIEPAISLPPHVQWPNWPDLLWEILFLFSDLRSMGVGWETRAHARLAIIFSRLLSLNSAPFTIPKSILSDDELLLDQINQYLYQNLAQPFDAKRLAAQLGMSKRSLYRYYQKFTAVPLTHLLFILRMERAQELLLDTTMGLKAIAMLVGFSDLSHFCHRFRTHMGITPLKYRQQGSTGEARRDELTVG